MKRSEYVDYSGIKRETIALVERWHLAAIGMMEPKRVEEVRKEVIRLVVRFSEGAAACAQEQAMLAFRDFAATPNGEDDDLSEILEGE